MSLLKFIMPEMLEKSTSTLTKIFQLSNSESDFARKRALEAKAILDPFVMRRIKVCFFSDVLRNILNFRKLLNKKRFAKLFFPLGKCTERLATQNGRDNERETARFPARLLRRD